MSRRAVQWIVGLGVLDIVVFALTLHAHLTFHRTPNSPTVMTVGQVLGWLITGVLLVAIALIVKESRR